MKRAAIVLVLAIGGCNSTKAQNLAQCEVDADRVFANSHNLEDGVLEERRQGHVKNCMLTKGYVVNVTDEHGSVVCGYIASYHDTEYYRRPTLNETIP
jgi:hypothetical protein